MSGISGNEPNNFVPFANMTPNNDPTMTTKRTITCLKRDIIDIIAAVLDQLK